MTQSHGTLYEHVGPAGKIVSTLTQHGASLILNLSLKPFGTTHEPVEAQFARDKSELSRAGGKIMASGTIQIGGNPARRCILTYYPRYQRVHISAA